MLKLRDLSPLNNSWFTSDVVVCLHDNLYVCTLWQSQYYHTCHILIIKLGNFSYFYSIKSQAEFASSFPTVDWKGSCQRCSPAVNQQYCNQLNRTVPDNNKLFNRYNCKHKDVPSHLIISLHSSYTVAVPTVTVQGGVSLKWEKNQAGLRYSPNKMVRCLELRVQSCQFCVCWIFNQWVRSDISMYGCHWQPPSVH